MVGICEKVTVGTEANRRIRKLRHDEIIDFCSSPDIITMIYLREWDELDM
jgi:hypothetical protein